MSAFDRIYRENFRFVWAAAHRCGVPADAVEDVVQDVFITAHRRLHELDWEVSARGWLFGVTRNVSMRHRRGSARRSRREAIVARDSVGAVHPHRRHDAARTLDALLASLSVSLREVFEMSEMLGMTAPEVAAALGIPSNTVYSRLRLARRKVAAEAGSMARLEREVAALREATKPTVRDRERAHAALLPLLQIPWWSFPTLLGSMAKPALVVVVVMIGVAVFARDDAPLSPSPPAQPERASEAAPALPDSALPAALPASALGGPASQGPVGTAPRSLSAARPRPPRPVANADEVVSPGPGPDLLSAEIALLDRARAALERGDPDASLRILGDYEQTFPEGQLSAACLVTRTRARCQVERRTGLAASDPAAMPGEPKNRSQCPEVVTDVQGGGEP